MPKAALADAIGPWDEVIQIVELPPLPPPPADSIQIAVSACGMGFPDMLQVEGKYQTKAEPPFVPVQYAVGTVTAVGAEVAGFTVSDREQPTGGSGGSLEPPGPLS
jgi:NADPH2:quinone reductase